MLVAPDYNTISTPYGLQNQSSNDLYDALNAAIANMQAEDTDETLLTKSNLTNLVRVYTCRQASKLPVSNRNETTGYLRDILDKKTKFLDKIKKEHNCVGYLHIPLFNIKKNMAIVECGGFGEGGTFIYKLNKNNKWEFYQTIEKWIQ
jgi:hypothetical protein